MTREGGMEKIWE